MSAQSLRENPDGRAARVLDSDDMAGKSDQEADRRVVMPGGEHLEAAAQVPDSRESGAATLRRGSHRQADLHVCPACGGSFVQPLEWAPSGTAQWRVDLRCPECEWHGSGVHDQKTMDRFDEILDDGTEALLEDLTQLTRAIMEEEVDRFVDALTRDLIQPEDF
jgi:hypothetical protein